MKLSDLRQKLEDRGLHHAAEAAKDVPNEERLLGVEVRHTTVRGRQRVSLEARDDNGTYCFTGLTSDDDEGLTGAVNHLGNWLRKVGR